MDGSGCSSTVVVVATVAADVDTRTVVEVTLDVVVVSSTDVLVDEDDDEDEVDAGTTVRLTRVSLVTDTESSSSRAISPDTDQTRAIREATPRTCSATGIAQSPFHQVLSAVRTVPGYACWPTGAPASASRANT